MKTALATILCLMPFIVHAAPLKIPTLSICIGVGGAVTAKQKCTRFETKLDFNALKAASVGPQGPAGTVNIAGCHIRESSASGALNVFATVPCLVSEFVTSSGCYISSGSAAVYYHKLVRGGPEGGGLLGDDLYQLVTCGAADPSNSGANFTLTAQAWCCRP